MVAYSCNNLFVVAFRNASSLSLSLSFYRFERNIWEVSNCKDTRSRLLIDWKYGHASLPFSLPLSSETQRILPTTKQPPLALYLAPSGSLFVTNNVLLPTNELESSLSLRRRIEWKQQQQQQQLGSLIHSLRSTIISFSPQISSFFVFFFFSFFYPSILRPYSKDHANFSVFLYSKHQTQ